MLRISYLCLYISLCRYFHPVIFSWLYTALEKLDSTRLYDAPYQAFESHCAVVPVQDTIYFTAGIFLLSFMLLVTHIFLLFHDFLLCIVLACLQLFIVLYNRSATSHSITWETRRRVKCMGKLLETK